MDSRATDGTPGELPAQAAQVELTAAVLASGRTIDGWSRVFALVGLVGLLWPALPGLSRPLLALSLAFATLQAWWAWRTALDAQVFAVWASAWRNRSAGLAGELSSFDQALCAWRPGDRTDPRPAPPARSLGDRLRGARNLFIKQFISFTGQVTCTFVALVTCWPA